MPRTVLFVREIIEKGFVTAASAGFGFMRVFPVRKLQPKTEGEKGEKVALVFDT